MSGSRQPLAGPVLIPVNPEYSSSIHSFIQFRSADALGTGCAPQCNARDCNLLHCIALAWQLHPIASRVNIAFDSALRIYLPHSVICYEA